MKNLTLIVHADIRQALADVLRGLPEVTGFTFTMVEATGRRTRAMRSFRRATAWSVTCRVRMDLVLEDTAVDKNVLEALQTSNCGVTGRGVYWITRVERQGRL